MSRLWWVRTRNFLRPRKRQAVVVAILSLGSIGMVFLSWRTAPDGGAGFMSDLWLNIGAGLAITLATYIALNPLFRELQTASLVEHARLDPSGLIERISRGRETVAILETWTGLLEEPYRDRFLAALRSALLNQAMVRILLLDPDSEGAQQRAKELRQRDVPLAIMTNLFHLCQLRDELHEDVRARLTVRVYDASPSVQMYRCDNKAFVSFFPIDQSTYDAQQIETLMSTPIGEFVQNRFDELWSAPSTATLTDATTLQLHLHRDDGTELELCDARFVRLDGTHYVTGPRLLKHVTRYGITSLRARLANGQPHPHRYLLDEADELEASIYHRVVSLFRAKYGLELLHLGATDPVIITLVPEALTSS
ncbi:MAG TPA: hypothetical protein VF163_21140 [Micromonosporaceae bacterium]